MERKPYLQTKQNLKSQFYSVLEQAKLMDAKHYNVKLFKTYQYNKVIIVHLDYVNYLSSPQTDVIVSWVLLVTEAVT